MEKRYSRNWQNRIILILVIVILILSFVTGSMMTLFLTTEGCQISTETKNFKLGDIYVVTTTDVYDYMRTLDEISSNEELVLTGVSTTKLDVGKGEVLEYVVTYEKYKGFVFEEDEELESRTNF